jgi:hypothetical protein
MRNMSDKSYIGRQNTHFMFNIFSKDGAIYEITEKYGRAEQATDVDMVHAFCMLDD